MISFEKAQALKEAGLTRKAQNGDYFHIGAHQHNPTLCVKGYYVPHDNDIWIPRLDQLLKKIEELGYLWVLSRYSVIIALRVDVETEDADLNEMRFEGEPEDAVADALLWILKEMGEK